MSEIDIYLSREQIRSKLLKEYADLLKVNEEILDQSDTSFNTFIINSLSQLQSDALFYASIIYRENTLVTANLSRSVYNWAKYLGYHPKTGRPLEVDAILYIPIETQSFEITIRNTHKFWTTDNIYFTPKYEYTIKLQGSSVEVLRQSREEGVIPMPFLITQHPSDENIMTISTIITLQQQIIKEYTTQVPLLDMFEFWYYSIPLPENESVATCQVFVNGSEWIQKPIVTMSPGEEAYELIIMPEEAEIAFGNGIFGKQPTGELLVRLGLTKGQLQIAKGSITKGETIVTSDNNIVKYYITNVSDTKGGQKFEQLDEIRRNAINWIYSLGRLVTERDYRNVSELTNEDVTSIPILRRSDLTTNDINIYMVLKLGDEIVPTSTITVPLPQNIIQIIRPWVDTFTYQNEEWVTCFRMKYNSQSLTYSCQLIPSKSSILLLKTWSNQLEKHSLLRAVSTYDPQTENINLNILGYRDENFDITEMKISLYSSDSISEYFANITIDPNYPKKFYGSLSINIQNIIGRYEIRISTKDTNNGMTLYKGNIEDIFESFTPVTYCHIVDINGQKHILDIPVIRKSWYNSLSEQRKEELEKLIVSNIFKKITDFEHRMMNVNISPKFAKTYGECTFHKYTTPDFTTIKICKSSSQLPPANSNQNLIVALDIQDTSDPLFPYSGRLAVSDGINWNILNVGSGTIIKNVDPLEPGTYTSTGKRWVLLTISSPIKCIAEIKMKSSNIDTINNVRKTIVDYINSRGIEGSIYISQIIDRIHNLDNISYCRIILPICDIIYRDILKNIPNPGPNSQNFDFFFYVPEYIYTRDDLVEVIEIL